MDPEGMANNFMTLFFSLFIFCTIVIYCSFDIFFILTSNSLSLFDVTKLIICMTIVFLFLYILIQRLTNGDNPNTDLVLNLIFEIFVIGLFILLILEFPKLGFGFWQFFKTFCAGYAAWFNYVRRWMEIVKFVV